MNFFKKQILGVDLGSRTIKGVQLKAGKDGKVQLIGHFFQDLSKTTENFPTQSTTGMRDEVFKAAIETQRLTSLNAATTIRDSDVLSFSFNLPPMSEKELSQVVPQEIADQSHIAVDDYSCDFIVSSAPTENPELKAVKAYCVKKDLVLEQMKTLKDAGLKAAAIESEMMAITAMLDFNDYIDQNEVVVVLDLGESHVTSGLIADGTLMMTKNHEVSFGAINQNLSAKFNLNYASAEKIKLNYDFLAGPDEHNAQYASAIDDVYTQIFKSVKEVLEFYKECRESYGRIDRILLVGGGSQIKSIDQVHETFFKVPTVVVNPFRNIDFFSTSKDQVANSAEELALLAPHMGTAVGLALASIEAGGKAA